MNLLIFLVVFGVVGATVLYIPAALLAAALFILRSSNKTQLEDLADRLDVFFDIHGVRYAVANRISFRKSGNGFIQFVLSIAAVLWKFVALGVGIWVAGWLLE